MAECRAPWGLELLILQRSDEGSPGDTGALWGQALQQVRAPGVKLWELLGQMRKRVLPLFCDDWQETSHAPSSNPPPAPPAPSALHRGNCATYQFRSQQTCPLLTLELLQNL